MNQTVSFPIPKTAINRGKHSDRLTPQQFRDAVWARDKFSRASGQPVLRGHDSMTVRGEVCHLQSRGAHPDLAVDPTNGILLSGHEHWLSDGRGGNLLRLYDPETSEPATDASKPILFVMRDRQGNVLWSRVR